jgi:hypothetical protein
VFESEKLDNDGAASRSWEYSDGAASRRSTLDLAMLLYTKSLGSPRHCVEDEYFFRGDFESALRELVWSHNSEGSV